MPKFEISPKLKAALGIVTIIGTGVSAVIGAISEQNKAKELEALKSAVKELQNK